MNNKKYHVQKVLINNLRYYRCKKEITQSHFAEILEISTNYYNAIENGKYFPSVEILERICKAHNIFPYQLFLENPLINPLESKQNLSIIKEEVSKILNCLL